MLKARINKDKRTLEIVKVNVGEPLLTDILTVKEALQLLNDGGSVAYVKIRNKGDLPEIRKRIYRINENEVYVEEYVSGKSCQMTNDELMETLFNLDYDTGSEFTFLTQMYFNPVAHCFYVQYLDASGNNFYYADINGNQSELDRPFIKYCDAIKLANEGKVIARINYDLMPDKFIYTMKGFNSMVHFRELLVAEIDGDIIPYSQDQLDSSSLWLEMTPDSYQSYRYQGGI